MWNRILLACTLCVVLAGCSTLRLQAPNLQVVNVTLLRGDLLSQELRVRIRVQNPNDRALPVRGITYEVQVAGEKFATGESERDFNVPALGDTEFDVDVKANAAGALLRLLANRDRGAPQYRILGKVRLASGMIKTIPFDHSGTLQLR